jgi:hypothetical protein
MAASEAIAALLRRLVRGCRRTADGGRDSITARKFTTLATELENSAAQIERHEGNGEV